MPNTHINQLYRSNFGLFCDLYHLTMAYGFWKSGKYERKAVFQAFYRENPFQHGYVINAGLELALDALDNFRFSPDDITYLGRLKGNNNKPLFDEGFLNYLQRMQLECDIYAIPEGTIAFPHQPLILVEGPLIQAQLLEALLLNLINYSTLIATKGARMVQASHGEAVLEFGMRRAQGLDGSITAARSAYIGGCHATSNVMAGKFYGIPVKGTHAHSWVMCFDDELTAFYEYAKAMPNNCIFLVDTYDTIQGIENAIEVGKWLQSIGHKMVGIRLDSGDLGGLSLIAREMLDEAGFEDASIVGSDGLDEQKIQFLKNQRSTINVWGVGTSLVTGKSKAALGGVYKLSAIEDEAGQWQYKIKLSETAIKVSNPGRIQVRRFFDNHDQPIADQLYDFDMGPSGEIFNEEKKKPIAVASNKFEDLLVKVVEKGKRIYQSPALKDIRLHSLQQQALFSNYISGNYPVGLESNLWKLKRELMASKK